MSYIGNQSGRIVYTNLNKFKGTVADLTELGAVTGASSGDMYKVEDSGHAHMYDGTLWVDMGPIVGPQGVKGTGITSVVRTLGDGSEGTVDTYTITYDDTSTSTFEVRNGTAGIINHIAKTDTAGTTDTYTAYADAAKTQPLGSFEVYNGVDGKGVESVAFTSTTDASGLAAQSGGVDTYTVFYTNGTEDTFLVYNGLDSAVESVQGRVGDVVITAEDIGLDNVDNTSDVNKPVSSAVQIALNLKANQSDVSNVDNTSDLDKPISTATQQALNLKADASDLNDAINSQVGTIQNFEEALV